MLAYFEEIDRKTKEAYSVAEAARSLGFDPETHVDIPVAIDMAERVEGLVSAVCPQIKGKGIPKRLRELEQQYSVLDWRISLVIALEIAQEKFCTFSNKLEAMEAGIRVGFAYHTLGTVASPLEGFTNLKVRKRKDGKEYLAICYSGPIRSAGGTGASVSVLIADYIRKQMGYDVYDPTDEETKRAVIEMYDYHERITNLQYLPSEKEIVFLVQHVPVQIDGDPSETIEVSNYKFLGRIETNQIRNGPCLVLGECIAQKAVKLWKQLSRWGKDFGLEHWNFLEIFIAIQREIKSKGKITGDKKIGPDHTFMVDMIAGRPILTYPMRYGGFRLRYGRTRTSGFSSYAIHPATMHILDKYIAVGTQLKLERPGKATTVTSCDSIEGPVVLLQNGSVLKLQDEREARRLAKEIKEILYLGDILINYGDFLNRGHPLVQPGYCEEWWAQELESSFAQAQYRQANIGNIGQQEQLQPDYLRLQSLISNPLTILPSLSFDEAYNISKTYNIPLHPQFTYYWTAISLEEFAALKVWFTQGAIVGEPSSYNDIEKIVLPFQEGPKRTLEILGIPHILVQLEFIVLEGDVAKTMYTILSAAGPAGMADSVLGTVEKAMGIRIMDKAGIFIGARMGRPEKAKLRKLKGSPSVLFPVGEEGGRMRSFQAALETGFVESSFPNFYCAACALDMVAAKCYRCGSQCLQQYFCKICGYGSDPECRHGRASKFSTRKITIGKLYEAAAAKAGNKVVPDNFKGVRGTSNKEHVTEHLLKGILRAKHDICVNKDGTTRYDMTQLGITHFRPKEIGLGISKAHELGYTIDIHGKELAADDQVLEIKPQDIILPSGSESTNEGAGKVLMRIAEFSDDLLEKLYGLPRYYNLQNEEDLIGHLVLGIAPHTSAAIAGRIIGFSKTQGFFAHPMFHAAMRRDLDGDESSIILLMDALLNFSRQYLPHHRGSVQDACLVMTSRLNPAEVDDMVFDIDVVWKYPLEFYHACQRGKHDIKLEKLGDRLHTPLQYEGMGYTHETSNINSGVLCSAYKTIPTMEEKLQGQMELARKIRAVDTADVAKLVIEKHFLKDIKGNLRKFSTQEFRCSKCNEKFRRPSLQGKCDACGSKLIFTVTEGSVIKYLESSVNLAQVYDAPPYLKQSLEVTKRRIEGVFGKASERQEGLTVWFSQ